MPHAVRIRNGLRFPTAAKTSLSSRPPPLGTPEPAPGVVGRKCLHARSHMPSDIVYRSCCCCPRRDGFPVNKSPAPSLSFVLSLGLCTPIRVQKKLAHDDWNQPSKTVHGRKDCLSQTLRVQLMDSTRNGPKQEPSAGPAPPADTTPL